MGLANGGPQAYNHKVNENKLQNEKTYASWLETLTPEQVRISNAARYNLTLKKVNTRRPIVDSRLPKRPVLAFSSFTKDRWASGDFKNISIVDASKQMGLEWKALSEAEKKVSALSRFNGIQANQHSPIWIVLRRIVGATRLNTKQSLATIVLPISRLSARRRKRELLDS